MTVFTE